MSGPAEGPPESGLQSACIPARLGSGRSSLRGRGQRPAPGTGPELSLSYVCVQRHLDKDMIIAASPHLHNIQGLRFGGALGSVLTSRTRHLEEAAQNARELHAAVQ